ncbi:MAG: hypothetical protein ABIH00_07055 [Armatimonadota bacterium]
MIDAFIEKIPFGVEENKFLLVNVLFKRIKQLTQRNVEQVSPLSSDEIITRAYNEVRDGKIKPLIKEEIIPEKIKTKRKLKEVPISEKPLKGRKKQKIKKVSKKK